MTRFPDTGLRLKGMLRRVQIAEVRRFFWADGDDTWYFVDASTDVISAFRRDGSALDFFISDDDLYRACAFYLRHDLNRAFDDVAAARVRAEHDGFL